MSPKQEDDVNITSKEQMLYYEMYRRHFGKPSEVYGTKIGRQCPNCKSYVKTELGFQSMRNLPNLNPFFGD